MRDGASWSAGGGGPAPVRQTSNATGALPSKATAGDGANGVLPSWRASLAAWLIGLLVLSSVIAIVLHLSELEEIARLLRTLRPTWLLAGAGLQCLTYVCAAAIWRMALEHSGYRIRLSTLIPLTLAMLFANQAFPSAGLAGSLLVVRGLERHEVPSGVGMRALLVGLGTTYAAYLIALLAAIVFMRAASHARADLVSLAAIFVLVSLAVPLALVWYRRSLAPRVRRHIDRLPGIGSVLTALDSSASALPADMRLLSKATVVQLFEMLLDGGTLAVLLGSLGVRVPLTEVLGAFAVAAVFSRIIPVPLALGTFEGSLVTALHAIDVPLEAALAATLLLRGLTLWLPMLPGLWCARRELRDRAGDRHRRHTVSAV